MATTFYARDRLIAVGSAGTNLLSVNRGNTVVTNNVIVPTTAATLTGADFTLFYNFVTKPLVAFTLAGQITAVVRGFESNAAANCTSSIRLYKLSGGILSASMLTLYGGTEFNNAETIITMTGTPINTVFNTGDQLVWSVGFTNIGNNGGNSSRTASLVYNGPTTGTSGDTKITFTETLIEKNRASAGT